MAKFGDVLKERNLLLLWLAQIISQFGDRLGHMALIGLVYKKAPGSAIQLAKLLAFTIIPLMLLGPVAGAYVDRWDRKKTMVACDVLRGLFVLLIPIFLFYTKAILPIYAVIFSVFAVGCLFIPARLAIISDLVANERLLLANSISTTTGVVAAFAGLAIGGVVVELIGPFGAFFIDAGTFFVSAMMIAAIRPRAPLEMEFLRGRAVQPVSPVARRSILQDIKEGLFYLKSSPDARSVANILILSASAAGSIYVVAIVLIQKSLGSATIHISAAGAILGAGFFAGSILFGRFFQRVNRRIAIASGLMASGILIALFALAMKLYADYLLALASVFLLGLFVSPVVISSNTLIHEIAQNEIRGRVFTMLGSLMAAAMLFFMFATAYLAERLDEMWILVCTGTFIAIFGACPAKICGGAWMTLRWFNRRTRF